MKNSIKTYFSIYFNNDYSIIKDMFIHLAIISFIGNILFYHILNDGFGMWDSLYFRYGISILSLIYIILYTIKRDFYIRTTYIEIITTIGLPILFNILLYMNNFNTYWSGSMFFAAIIFSSFVKPKKALIYWPIALILSIALLKYTLNQNISSEYLLIFLQINLGTYLMVIIGGAIQTYIIYSYSEKELMLKKIEEKNKILTIQKEQINIKNKELQSINTTKDKFFNIIAHDLRNPFNVLLNLSSILIKNHKKYTEQELENYIEMIYDSSKSTFSLLQNLLTWAMAQSGKIKFSQTKLSIKDVIDENILLTKPSADGKNIELINKITNDIFVYADKNMLNTILRNLITNAIKFTPNNKSINIYVNATTQNMIEISVKDTGIGITKDNINNLFRIEKNNSTLGTNNENGTGLGLILCKEFTEIHGGKIWVESELEHGSNFIFTLPLWQS